MNKIALLTAFALASMSGVAMAQTTAPKSPSTTAPSTAPAPAGMKTKAECDTAWKAADKNGDGKLDSTELTAVKASMPASLASKTSVNQQEYVTACTTGK